MYLAWDLLSFRRNSGFFQIVPELPNFTTKY
jgi:hypothetical protein